MLAAGMTYTSAGRIDAASGGVVTTYLQGFGFAGDSLAIGSAPITSYNKGIAMNVDSQMVTEDVSTAVIAAYIEGVPVTDDGTVVVESADPVIFVNGNPITAAGALSIT